LPQTTHWGVEGRRERGSACLEVGRAAEGQGATARPLTLEEILETAEVFVALLETQGKSVELTLSELGSEGGRVLLPEDVPLVREAARKLL
jgi:hypothetical protein